MEPFRTHYSVSRAKTAKGGSPDPAAGSRGVTLVELLVVAAIISILAIVVVIGQGAYNRTLLLANTAYDIALTIRSAQTFGLSNRTISAQLNNTGYGVHFDKNVLPDSFMLFADFDASAPTGPCHVAASGIANAPDAILGDCVYRPADVPSQTYKLGNGLIITDLCAYKGATKTCGLSSLDIIFVRPNTKTFVSQGGSYDGNSPYTKACVQVTSPQSPVSVHRYIYVEQTGEVRVNTSPC